MFHVEHSGVSSARLQLRHPTPALSTARDPGQSPEPCGSPDQEHSNTESECVIRTRCHQDNPSGDSNEEEVCYDQGPPYGLWQAQWGGRFRRVERREPIKAFRAFHRRGG